MIWYATKLDVNREVNNGRGPVDYKISYGGKNFILVEFKLASKTKLRKNLENQVWIYKKANLTENAIKVIMFFSDTELNKVKRILKEIGLEDWRDIVLIGARSNKVSSSNIE